MSVEIKPYFAAGERYPALIGVRADGDEYETAYVSKSEIRLLEKQAKRLLRKNDELRELVRDMWFWGYCGHMDGKSQEWQMKHISGVLERAYELGIEVDE